MDAFTAQQTTELVSRIGTKKSHQRLDKLFFNSCLAGPLLGFGCAVLLSAETAMWYQTNSPGLIRFIGALPFPIGLVMIVLSGADLFTSNVMFMGTALLHRRVGLLDVARNWVVSYLGNLAGMLFFMAIITGYGGVFEMEDYKTEVFNFATQKMLVPQWHQIMLRAIGANWLVCFAVFISISSREIISKIVAIWGPTATFVALGLDHVVANMFFIPTAIFYGHPDIGVGLYIWKSMIPTAIGNIIGGFIFMALPYWYLYLTGEGNIEIHFDIGTLSTAMDVGGPMGPDRPMQQRGAPPRDERVITGTEKIQASRSEADSEQTLPDSACMAKSGIAKELNAAQYAKRKGEPTSPNSPV